jgi:hypothetical protein
MTMANTNDTSKARPGRNTESVVIEAIEAERTRLMQAESLLDCLLAAMDEDEVDPHGPYVPNVIKLARDRVHRSIDQLDSLNLRPLLTAMTEENVARDAGDANKVKEPGALYLIQ